MLSIRTKIRPKSNRLNHDSPLTEPNKKIDNNLGEYIALKNTSGRNLALGDVQVGQGGNWWQFSATDTLVPNAYALVCYGTSADQAQFLSANNLPLALTTDPTVQWHWQSTIDFPDAEGQATVRLFENGKPGATLDQVYWNPDGLQAINAYCDATCQVDPNREAVQSLQLDDYTYDPINPWDASKWTTAEATAKGKGTSQPEAPTAVRGLLKKEYELKDHLGNVHVVVTDRKHSDVSGLSVTDFKADVVVMRDYYPFGMEMEGQGYAAGDYRYGFNGMVPKAFGSDNELKGSGDSYDFGARMYDPRVGRWMSRDPLEEKYSGISPYVFVNNMPITAIDPDGEYVYIVINGEKYRVTIPLLKNAKGNNIYNYAMRVACQIDLTELKQNIQSAGHDVYFVFKDVDGTLQDRWHEALPNAQVFNKGSAEKFTFDEEKFLNFSKEKAPWSNFDENKLAAYSELNGTDISASKGKTYSMIFLNNEDFKLGDNPKLKEVLDKIYELAYTYSHEEGAHIDERNNPNNPGGYHNGQGKKQSSWDANDMDITVKQSLQINRIELEKHINREKKNNDE